MNILSELTYINNSSLALGFFDGIHLGHKIVLKNAISIARKQNAKSVVILFKEHPLCSISNEKVELLLTNEEKLKILENLGVDTVVMLDFKDYNNIKAEDYLKDIIVKYFNPVAITTGFNHYFGFNKEGNTDLLERNKKLYNYDYYKVPPCVHNGEIISCTTIRNKLNLGDFLCANELLGYKYFIHGKVIAGDKLARQLGFPSANINYPENKIEIPHGVYFVKVRHNQYEYNGILNHGYAPTLSDENRLKTEVHILDFNKDIYAENITISFVTKIRNQMKFDSVEKLKKQIKRDIAFVEIYKYFLNDKVNHTCKHFFM